MNRLKLALLKHGQDTRKNLAFFSTGAALFFLGYGVLNWSDRSLLASVGQELVATIGVILLICGGLSALYGYLGLSVLRLYNWLTEDIYSNTSKTKNNETKE